MRFAQLVSSAAVSRATLPIAVRNACRESAVDPPSSTESCGARPRVPERSVFFTMPLPAGENRAVAGGSCMTSTALPRTLHLGRGVLRAYTSLGATGDLGVE